MSLAWWNGRIVPAEEVRISPGDSGFLFGDGLFETLRVDDGRALDVEAHLDRLLTGLRRVEIELPETRRTLEQAVEEIAAAAPRPVARLRLTVTRGTRLLTAAPYEPPGEDLYRQGVAVRLFPEYRVDSAGPLAGLKSLGYQANRLALRAAESQGAWEALLLNEHGRVVEGSRSNLVLVLSGTSGTSGTAFTPPLSDGCLPGTVRRRLLETGALAERPLSPGDLATAGEVLLMNSLIGVLPVSKIDDRKIPAGPTAERLRRAWAARLCKMDAPMARLARPLHPGPAP